MSSYLNQERKVPGSRTVYKWKQPNTVLNMSVDFDVVGKQGMGFFTGGSIIIDYEFIFWPNKHWFFTRCSLMGWSHVDYLWIKVVAHWVRNCRPKFTLTNKYDLTLLCQSCLHNASETFICHEKIGKALIFCIFGCIACILIAKDEEYEKTEKRMQTFRTQCAMIITVMFLSAVWSGHWFRRHPFTAEHPLVSKWCNTEFFQMCSDKERKYSTSVVLKLFTPSTTSENIWLSKYHHYDQH